MTTGKDMLIQTMVKTLMANLPPEVFDNIKQIGVTVGEFKAQLDRMETELKEIRGNIQTLKAFPNAEFPGIGSASSEAIAEHSAINGNAGK